MDSSQIMEITKVIVCILLLFTTVFAIAEKRMNEHYYKSMINALWTAVNKAGLQSVVVKKSDIRDHVKTLQVEIGRRIVIFSND
jgi:hypothetical protein